MCVLVSSDGLIETGKPVLSVREIRERTMSSRGSTVGMMS